MDESSKDFIFKHAEKDYEIDKLRLDVTRSRVKIKSIVEPVKKVNII
jgi:hypothetical protein